MKEIKKTVPMQEESSKNLCEWEKNVEFEKLKLYG